MITKFIGSNAINILSRWEFLSEGGDVGFGISRISSNEIVELVPHGRVDSHLLIEEGQIVCDCIGKCKNYCFFSAMSNKPMPFFSADVVEFDNGFSYLKTKKVHYAIAIDLPKTN